MKTLAADGKTLANYCLDSSKFYQTYDFYKHIDSDEVKSRLYYITHHVNPQITKEFYEELELCMVAALEDKSNISPTQVFFQYVIDLIELHNSNARFSEQAKELIDCSIEYLEPFIISNDVLDEYERSLVHEYYIMGYDSAELADKKKSDASNIRRKISKALSKLRN